MNIYLLTYMGLASCNEIPQLFVWLRSLLGERLLWWLYFIGGHCGLFWGSGYCGGYASSGVIALMVGWGYAFWYEQLWIWGRGLQSVAEYLGLARVFVWGGALRREGFNCCFAGLFCYWWRSVYFVWGTGRWAIILWSLGSVLIFPNFLRS